MARTLANPCLGCEPKARVVTSSLHSSSFSECVEGKPYNEKIQIAQMIIRDIYMTRRFAVEILRRSNKHWCVREQTKLRVTLVNPMFIEESKENKIVE